MLLSTWRSADTFEDPAAIRRAVLEVHIGRFYRTRPFGVIDQATLGEFDVAWTDYDIDDSRVHLVVGYFALADLPAWSEALADHVASMPPDDELVIDVVGWRDGERPDIDDAAAELGALLDRCRFGRQVRRIDVDITSSATPGDDRFWSQNLTFRQEPDGVTSSRTSCTGICIRCSPSGSRCGVCRTSASNDDRRRRTSTCSTGSPTPIRVISDCSPSRRSAT
jgi:hypothetical protein